MSESILPECVFGPVPSRRLGRSLGVDLVPFKTCSYDCVYCQLGRTTNRTVRRVEYVPASAVLEQLAAKLQTDPTVDYLTFSGSGEPTLHVAIGSIIAAIKQRWDLPVAVLTNGSLLWMDQVQQALLAADVVLPSLDAAEPRDFERINRPEPSLRFDQVLEGLCAFRRRYSGRFWLEIFLIEGWNTSPRQLNLFARAIERIEPDCVHLNTAVRPTAEPGLAPVEPDRLAAIAKRLGPRVQIVAGPTPGDPTRSTGTVLREQILDLLRRRPCTLADIASALRVPQATVLKHVGALAEAGQLSVQRHGGRLFYSCRS